MASWGFKGISVTRKGKVCRKEKRAVDVCMGENDRICRHIPFHRSGIREVIRGIEQIKRLVVSAAD
jgi:hypothetical protein